MTTSSLRWDPYDPAILADPFPFYRRLRDEAPLYYNAEHDFFAVSRYDDVEPGLRDRETYSSARGAVLEVIRANAAIPPAVLIFQDPPVHTVYRTVLTRLFSPKRMLALEARIRDYCAQCLDPHVGGAGFDFVGDLGAKMPMRVIGMLLGIPERDHETVRQFANTRMRTEVGKPMDVAQRTYEGEAFDDYVKWRGANPSDDVVTEMLTSEIRDETGATRRLSREEVLTLVSILAGAGNETTNRLIGWTGKVLGEHPDQRRQVAQSRELVPQTIEELLRFQPPTTHIARYVTRDVELHGQKVPAGSVMMFLSGSANRDERRFAHADRFDIHREKRSHVTFGSGIHTCVGAVLARLEGRIALEEILARFPDWEVDLDRAELSSTSTVRGWETMPVRLPNAPLRSAVAAAASPQEGVAAAPAASVEGSWKLTIKAPTGAQVTTLTLKRVDGLLTGTQSSQDSSAAITEASYENGKLRWINHSTKMMKMKLEFTAMVTGDQIQGKVKAGFMGSYPFTGVRI